MFGAVDGGAGMGHEGSLQSSLGTLTSGRTYLNVLITELYGIAGVVNILLDVTFLCVVI